MELDALSIQAVRNGAKNVITYVTQIIVQTENWHATFWYDRSTGTKQVFLVGDPEAFRQEIVRVIPDPGNYGPAIEREIEKRSDPFRVIPIPGKKRAKEKVNTDQLEVGGTVEPIFGQPETGKKPRKSRKK